MIAKQHLTPVAGSVPSRSLSGMNEDYLETMTSLLCLPVQLPVNMEGHFDL